MRELFLGIDTSNYKTSAAVTDADGNVIYQRSEYLEVPHGSRGLRQSECFFRHSNRLPDYIAGISRSVNMSDIRAVGVSSRPRRVEGSYMPCFLAGVNAAGVIASALGIPVYEFSHQEGHAAAILDDNTAGSERAILMHLSGGTTEILLCSPDAQGYDLEITGGTRDISAGQLIDRAGVAMGYDFPSGMYLDELALNYTPSGKAGPGLARIRITDGYFNLSGTETQVMRWIEASEPSQYPYIAYSIFTRIAELLANSARASAASAGVSRVYMAGGVSASHFIRKHICSIPAAADPFPEIVFGDPALSGDNAVGIARLARKLFIQNS